MRIYNPFRKIKTFIYNLYHKVRSKIRETHKIILDSKEDNLDKEPKNRNFYEVFLDWVYDVLQYGTLLSTSLIPFNIRWYNHLLWIIPLGVCKWLVFDLIKTYKKIK